MNFASGQIRTENGSTVLESDGIRLPISSKVFPPTPDGRITVGFRPEHVLVMAANGSGATAQIELIEPVGPVTYLDLSAGGRSFRASVAGNSAYATGDTVGFALDPLSAHFFNPDNGLRIGAERPENGSPPV